MGAGGSKELLSLKELNGFLLDSIVCTPILISSASD
jgi:hypothetical protein